MFFKILIKKNKHQFHHSSQFKQMKKFYLLLTLIVITAIQVANAQAPQGIPYQAVARDNAGNLIKNQPISLRFSIHDGSASGAVVYSETHAVTTDALGLFSVNIGGGTSSATLADVNWGSGSKYTQVELDVAGGSNYIDMGTTQMMSVPYALYAGSAGSATTMGSIGSSSSTNGGTITSGVLNLTPADANNGGVVTTGDQTFAGNKTFVSDLKVNGITVGRGGGNVDENIAIGIAALPYNSTGYGNIAAGYIALLSNSTGNNNIAMGTNSLLNNNDGSNNIAIGTNTLRSSNAYGNTALGVNSLFSNTSGTQNVASGNGALSNNTVGNYNTANGVQALYSNASGSNNTALGYQADVAGTFSNATAIGSGAKVAASNTIQLGNADVTNVNTSGTYTGAGFKTPNGTNTEFLMADGTTSVGPDLTGYATTDALNNTASMLSTNLDDEIVRAITAEADLSNQISNVQSNFVTTSSDPNNISNVNSGNVGIGTDLPSEKLDVAGNLKVRGNISNGGSNASGPYSIATGLNTTASGQYSTAMGESSVSNGYSTTALGIASTASGWGATAIGILSSAEGSSSVALGSRAKAYSLSEIAVGQFNTAYALNTPTSTYEFNGADRIFVVGNGQDDNNLSDAMVVLKNGNTTINGDVTANSIKILNGTNTQYLMADGTTSAGAVATTMGSIGDSPSANGGTITSGVLNLTPADANNGGVVTTGDQTFAGNKTFVSDLNVNGITIGTRGGNLGNTVIGGNALANNSTGYWNNAIGANALSSNSTGNFNVADGLNALLSNTTGETNTAIGVNTLESNTTGSGNIAIGTSSLQASNANYNIALGSAALFSNTSGTQNVASGSSSIFQNTTGNNNTANGFQALYSNVSGSNNTALGYTADVATGDLSNATAIGSGAIVNASNKIQLGNTNVTSVNTSGTYTGAGFVKAGGTSSEMLMANGTSSAIIRGTVASNGTVSIGNGFSSYVNTIGYISITFNTPFTTLPIVVATLQNSPGFISVTNVTTTGFMVVIGNVGGSSMSGSFSFIVMAP